LFRRSTSRKQNKKTNKTALLHGAATLKVKKVMSPFAMTVVLVVAIGVFTWSAIRRTRLLLLGGPDPRANVTAENLPQRIRDTLVYAFGQKKMPYYPVPGFAHILIFFGFLTLLLRSLVLWTRGYIPDFDAWGILALDAPLGIAYNVVKDLFTVLVLIGAFIFVYYRVIIKEKRMTLSLEGLTILGIIITMMLADVLYDAASIVMERTESGMPVSFSAVEPVGSISAMMLAPASLGHGPLKVLQHIGFWWHSTFVLLFLNLLPYTKHFHILTAIPNVFLRRSMPPGKLVNIEDLEGKVEREERIGRVQVTDLNWKDRLDLYACTECGRCSDNCPAFNTDKKLSPKHLILAQRDHLYATESHFIKSDVGNPGEKPPAEGSTEVPSDQPKKTIHGDPPKDAYFYSTKPVDIVPNVVAPDVIWACTTCRACEEQCPVLIDHVEGILQLRRNKVMIENDFPSELTKPFTGIETNSNPWNLSAMDRDAWTEGLEVPRLSDNRQAEVLYWVGCAASFDDRAKKTARSLVKLLQKAGVNFAILGNEEGCCGDPARRAGNEYLFQMIAAQNVETFKKYEVEKKKILTACPHGYNIFKKEYSDFGGNYQVVHHTDFLLDLIRSGKLKPTSQVQSRVVLHDSCYVGRYNAIYDAPREILRAIPGIDLVEPPYWTRNRAMCCGAGGAQMFMEEQGEKDKRINFTRTKQLLETNPQVIASECPFCMTMLLDGLKAEEKEEQIQQLDVLELLAKSVALE
jgi:Fe-S oxidoreductase